MGKWSIYPLLLCVFFSRISVLCLYVYMLFGCMRGSVLDPYCVAKPGISVCMSWGCNGIQMLHCVVWIALLDLYGAVLGGGALCFDAPFPVLFPVFLASAGSDQVGVRRQDEGQGELLRRRL